MGIRILYVVHTLVYVNTNYVYYNVQASLSGGPLHAPYEWRGLAGSQRCSRNEKRSTFFLPFYIYSVRFSLLGMPYSDYVSPVAHLLRSWPFFTVDIVLLFSKVSFSFLA
jgi:hypothetical protein